MVLSGASIGLFSLAPATFVLVQEVLVGLQIILESYLIYAVHTAVNTADWGSTNGKSYFVHGLALFISLTVEAGLILMPILMPATTSDSTGSDVCDPSTDSTCSTDNTACDPTTSPTCIVAPADDATCDPTNPTCIPALWTIWAILFNFHLKNLTS